MKFNSSFRKLSAEHLERRQMFSADLTFELSEFADYYPETNELRSKIPQVKVDSHQGTGGRAKDTLPNAEPFRQVKDHQRDHGFGSGVSGGQSFDDSGPHHQRRQDRKIVFGIQVDRVPSGEFSSAIDPVQRKFDAVVVQPLNRSLGSAAESSRERPVQLAAVVNRTELLLVATVVSPINAQRNILVGVASQNSVSLPTRLATSSNLPTTVPVRSAENLQVLDFQRSSINEFLAQPSMGSNTAKWLSDLSIPLAVSEPMTMNWGQRTEWRVLSQAIVTKSSLDEVDENDELIELSTRTFDVLSQGVVDEFFQEWNLDQKTVKNLSRLANQRQDPRTVRNIASRCRNVAASWFHDESGLIEIAESFHPVFIQPSAKSNTQVAIQLDSIMGLHRIVESLEIVDESDSRIHETGSRNALPSDRVFEEISEEMCANGGGKEIKDGPIDESVRPETSAVFWTTLLVLFSFRRIKNKRKID